MIFNELSKHGKIAVVAHDAGAANHILSWLKEINLSREKFSLCLGGPAKKIFSIDESLKDCKLHSLEESLLGADCLLSGTGWASTLEHDARVLAKQTNIRCIAVLDHWSEYRERFYFKNKICFADEAWVVDEYAKKLAEKLIPESKVLQMPNLFLDYQVEKVKQLCIERGHSKEVRILYLMEPFLSYWSDGQEDAGEFVAFKFFIENIRKVVKENLPISIIIRPHPSDAINKYNHLEQTQLENKITITCLEDELLFEQIAEADLVVGCNTYAMVIALAAGKTVISSLPPMAPDCILPQGGIIHLKKKVYRKGVSHEIL